MKNAPKVRELDVSDERTDDTPIHGSVGFSPEDDTVGETDEIDDSKDDEDDHVVISGTPSAVNREVFSEDAVLEPPQDSDVQESVIEAPEKKGRLSGLFGKKRKDQLTDVVSDVETQSDTKIAAKNKRNPDSESAPKSDPKSGMKPEPKQKRGLFSRKKATAVAETMVEPVGEASVESAAKHSTKTASEKKEKKLKTKPERPAEQSGGNSSMRKRLGLVSTVVLLLLFLGATAMLFIEKGKTSDAEKKISELDSRIGSLQTQLNQARQSGTDEPVVPEIGPEEGGERETPAAENPEEPDSIDIDVPEMPEIDFVEPDFHPEGNGGAIETG